MTCSHPLVLAALGCVVCADAARAERWAFSPSVTSRATWTDNSGFEDRATADADTLLEVTPRFTLSGEGKRLKLRGSADLTEVVYLRGTRPNRFLPRVDLNLNAEAIERFFFLDAGIVSGQTRENAFGPRPGGASSVNNVTTTQYRLTPYFQGKLGGEVGYKLSSANIWTQVSGANASTETAAGYAGQHVLRVDQAPRPFGWAVEAARSDTLFESGVTGRVTNDSARLILPYALSSTSTFSLRGGYERQEVRSTDSTAQVGLQQVKRSLYGADLTWRPTERTDLSALWESRYFGSGWRATFNHAMPWLAWSLATSRDVTSLPQSLLTLPPTNNVAALLDTALRTRIPDDVQRGRAVNDIMTREGLPNALGAQTTLVDQRVSLVTATNASVAILGVRNTVVLSGYRSKTEDLPSSLFNLVNAGTQNSVQTGGAVTYSHRFTPSAAGNLTADLTRTQGVGAASSLASRQWGVRLELSEQLTAKTNVFAGVRAQFFRSNVGGTTLAGTSADAIPAVAREHAVYAGLTHRF